MVTVNISGIQGMVNKLRGKLLSITEKDSVTRVVASTMAGVVRKRIHEQGKNADDTNIGDYDEKYLRVRQKNNRGTSKKVIISLTRELENDFGLSVTNPIKTSGGWGIGFVRNTDRDGVTHSDISNYMEEKYGKIWSLTSKEYNMAIMVAQGETNKILRSK